MNDSPLNFIDPFGTEAEEKGDPTSGAGAGYSNENISDLVSFVNGVVQYAPGYDFATLIKKSYNQEKITSFVLILGVLDLTGAGGAISDIATKIGLPVLKKLLRHEKVINNPKMLKFIQKCISSLDEAADVAGVAGKSADDIAEIGSKSKYINKTGKASRISNIWTNKNINEVSEVLTSRGFKKHISNDGKNVIIFTKDNLKYTIRDFATSEGVNDTLEFFIDNVQKLKIRLNK